MIDFFKELTRRKVWLFGGIYLALGWVLLQVAALIENTLSLPGWVDQIALVLLGLGFPMALLLAWAQESQGGGRVQSASKAGSGDPEPASERPGFSIAVLPFDDLSQSGDLGSIANGVPEDILTHLSFYSELIVSARNSSFAFKGTSPDIRDVGVRLGVRFVLEGSIRKVGDNVRVTAQLIEALSGAHAWSENYDRPLANLETEVDDIVDQIVFETWTAIATHEEARLLALDIKDLTVSDLLLLTHLHNAQISLPRLRKAEIWVARALELAPDDVAANAAMARILADMSILGSGDQQEHRSKAARHFEKAKQTRVPDIGILIDLAGAANSLGKRGEADIYTDQMMQVAPKHPATWGFRCGALMRVGKYEEALEANARGATLCSYRSPFRAIFVSNDAAIHMGLRDFAVAEARCREHLATGANERSQRLLVVALAHQGKLEDAGKEAEGLKKYWPDLTLVTVERMLRNWNVADEGIKLQLEGLRLAGVE